MKPDGDYLFQKAIPCQFFTPFLSYSVPSSSVFPILSPSFLQGLPRWVGEYAWSWRVGWGREEKGALETAGFVMIR
jgi:hypothetical protein